MNAKIQTEYGTAQINPQGYLRIISGKEGNWGKYIHRLIFEEFYQIDLNKELPGFVVHHEDGNKLNNEIWNLNVMPMGEHTRHHFLGERNPNYGKKFSEETRKKMSDAQRGKKLSEQTKQKLSEINTGKKHSIDNKIKISQSANTTGYFRVSKMKNSNYSQGFTYRYTYTKNGKRKALTSTSIENLKRKVIERGLLWKSLKE